MFHKSGGAAALAVFITHYFELGEFGQRCLSCHHNKTDALQSRYQNRPRFYRQQRAIAWLYHRQQRLAFCA